MYTASHIITIGALAGLTSVMLVMLLGQTRVLFAMANDGLLRGNSCRGSSKVPHAIQKHHSGRFAGGYRWCSITPIDDIGKMVNIGTLLAFVMVCNRRHDLAPH